MSYQSGRVPSCGFEDPSWSAEITSCTPTSFSIHRNKILPDSRSPPLTGAYIRDISRRQQRALVSLVLENRKLVD